MCDSMIKRVALKLKAVEDGSWCITPGIEEALARAAIEAMREPTEAMIDAFRKNDPPVDSPKNLIISDWQAMIDAALKE